VSLACFLPSAKSASVQTLHRIRAFKAVLRYIGLRITKEINHATNISLLAILASVIYVTIRGDKPQANGLGFSTLSMRIMSALSFNQNKQSDLAMFFDRAFRSEPLGLPQTEACGGAKLFVMRKQQF